MSFRLSEPQSQHDLALGVQATEKALLDSVDCARRNAGSASELGFADQLGFTDLEQAIIVFLGSF